MGAYKRGGGCGAYKRECGVISGSVGLISGSVGVISGVGGVGLISEVEGVGLISGSVGVISGGVGGAYKPGKGYNRRFTVYFL